MTTQTDPPIRPGTTGGTCSRCGNKLSWRQRILGREHCGNCTVELRDEVNKHRRLYLGAITALDVRSDLGATERGTLAGLQPEQLGADWHQAMATGALVFLFEQAIEDEVVTADEDRRIDDAARVLRMDRAAALRSRAGLEEQVTVARANAGTLPVLAGARLRLREGEVLHLETTAELVGSLDARPGSRLPQGLAFARGSRIPPPAASARMPALGGAGRPEDAGRLFVTSQRIVFRYRRQTISMTHGRLIGFTIYRDAVGFRLSGRKKTRLFRTAHPSTVAALASAASAKEGVSGGTPHRASQRPERAGASPHDR